MADFIPHNLFVIGSTGWLGSQVTQALLDKKAFNLRLLVRKDTFEAKKALLEGFKAAGATLVEGDTSNAASLAEAFKGSDTVVSILGGDGLNTGQQANIIEAATAAGVRRVVPSEFGFHLEDPTDFVLGGKIKLREALINSGLEYTFIFTSGFYEFLFGPLTGFNVKEGKLTIPGDGNQPFSTTHTSDIAKFVPEILLDPSSKNRNVHIYGEVITHNQAIKIFEEELGQKFEVTYQSEADLLKIEENQENPFSDRIFAHLKKILIFSNQAYDAADRQRYSKAVTPKTIREFAQSFKQ